MLEVLTGLPSGSEFWWIFLTPLIVLLLKTAFKYVTKLAVFVQEKPDPVAKRAAHFDCLRSGVDLAIIGLVATAGTLRVALRTQQAGRISEIATFGIDFILMQTDFVVATAIFSAIFYSPEKAFYKGVFVPTPLGCLSVYTGIKIFEWMMRP
jgi:hypothetical protein